jgi:hypothetical protein
VPSASRIRIGRLPIAGAAALLLSVLAGCHAADRPVPDVVGLPLDQAQAALDDDGFTDVSAQGRYGGPFILNEGTWAVLSQHPPAGKRADSGDPVRLEVGPIDHPRTLGLVPAGSQVAAMIGKARGDDADKPPADTNDPQPSKRKAERADADDAAPLVSVVDLGLPSAYAPDRESDAYGQRRSRAIPRDLAAYLVAVRKHDPATADSVASSLRLVPAAWCSLWLPHRTEADWEAMLRQADQVGADLARRLGAPFRVPNSPRVTALMKKARDEAASRFCPAHRASAGKPASHPTGAGRFAGAGKSHLDLKPSLLDASDFFIGYETKHNVAEPTDHVRLVYLDLLGMPTRPWPHRAWPVMLSCDQNAQMLSEDMREGTIRNIQRDNATVETHSVEDRTRTATAQAAFHFDALVTAFLQDC